MNGDIHTKGDTMSWIYYHDAVNKVVKAMRADPSVFEKKDKRGRRTGWHVGSEIRITRADNKFLSSTHRWKYPVCEHPYQSFDSKDSREDVLHYFFVNHAPNLTEIDAMEYERLRQEYKAQAENNKD